MRIAYIYFILLLFCLSSSKLQAQEELFLESVISIGLENNFGIKIAEQNIRIAENNNTWARAGKGITVDVNGSFSNSLTRNNNPASFIQGNFYNGALGVSLDANWTVYSGGRITINKDQLSLDVQNQLLNQEVAIHDLYRELIQNYYNVILQQERYDQLQSSLTLSKRRLEYENVRKDFGSSNSFNLVQFESAQLNDSLALKAQELQVEQAKNQLFQSLNIESSDDYVFVEKLSVDIEEIDADALKNQLSEENYTLKTLAVVQELNILNTKLARAAKKPTVNLNASVGFTENGFKFFADDPNTGEPFPFTLGNNISGSLNAIVSYGLIDRGIRDTNIANAELQEDIDQISIEQAQYVLNQQLEQLVTNYDNQIAQLQISDEQIEVARKSVDLTEERFKSGQLSSIDLINVQNQLTATLFSKINTIYGLLITKNEIDYLVGRY